MQNILHKEITKGILADWQKSPCEPWHQCHEANATPPRRNTNTTLYHVCRQDVGEPQCFTSGLRYQAFGCSFSTATARATHCPLSMLACSYTSTRAENTGHHDTVKHWTLHFELKKYQAPSKRDPGFVRFQQCREESPPWCRFLKKWLKIIEFSGILQNSFGFY